MKRIILSTTVLILILSVVFVGCKKNQSTENVELQEQYLDAKALKQNVDVQIQKEIAFFKEHLGIDVSNLELRNGEYIIEKDIFITRTDLQKLMKEDNTNVASKHRKEVSMATSGAKTVYRHTGLTADWATAVSQACSEWNALGLTITFTLSSSGSTYNAGGLTVFMDASLPAGTAGQTNFPSGNPIGTQMRLNPAFNILTASQKKYTVAHEIGHALGFRHTNSSDGNPINSWDYPCVPFSCDGIDNSSVLKAGSGSIPSWVGFSYCDQQVFGCLY